MTKTLVADDTPDPERPRDYGFTANYTGNSAIFRNIGFASVVMQNLSLRAHPEQPRADEFDLGFYNGQTIEGEVAEDPKPQKEIEE